jgi:hypothetical protein
VFRHRRALSSKWVSQTRDCEQGRPKDREMGSIAEAMAGMGSQPIPVRMGREGNAGVLIVLCVAPNQARLLKYD